MNSNITPKRQSLQLLKQLKKVLYFSVLIIFLSCNNKKFTKELWNKQDDLHEYPYRKDIIDDLLSNYRLKGLSYDKLIDIIGLHDDKIIMGTANEIYYPIETKYEILGIDPIYIKLLAIKLTKDSVVESYKIIEPIEH